MSLYQAKHKARGRYGVLTPDGLWLTDFLGTKEEAINKADQLNQTISIARPVTVEKANKKNVSNRLPKIHFTLTKEGWLNTGEA